MTDAHRTKDGEVYFPHGVPFHRPSRDCVYCEVSRLASEIKIRDNEIEKLTANLALEHTKRKYPNALRELADCPQENEVERWLRELKEANWMKLSRDTWQSPSGLVFRGPFKAWVVMDALKAHGMTT